MYALHRMIEPRGSIRQVGKTTVSHDAIDPLGSIIRCNAYIADVAQERYERRRGPRSSTAPGQNRQMGLA